MYAAVEEPLIVFKSATLLEILHSLTRIVRSPVTATPPQVGSSLYVKWASSTASPRDGPISSSSEIEECEQCCLASSKRKRTTEHQNEWIDNSDGCKAARHSRLKTTLQRRGQS